MNVNCIRSNDWNNIWLVLKQLVNVCSVLTPCRWNVKISKNISFCVQGTCWLLRLRSVSLNPDSSRCRIGNVVCFCWKVKTYSFVVYFTSYRQQFYIHGGSIHFYCPLIAYNWFLLWCCLSVDTSWVDVNKAPPGRRQFFLTSCSFFSAVQMTAGLSIVALLSMMVASRNWLNRRK